MKKLAISAALAAGFGLGSLAVTHAALKPPPPKTDAEKAAEAEKAAAAKAKESADNDKAMEKAVANYRKNKGIAEPKGGKASPASTSGKK